MPLVILLLSLFAAFIIYAFVKGFRSPSPQKPPAPPPASERTQCSVCGTASVKWNGQQCSAECEARLAKSMDDQHDRFEEMDN